MDDLFFSLSKQVDTMRKQLPRDLFRDDDVWTYAGELQIKIYYLMASLIDGSADPHCVCDILDHTIDFLEYAKNKHTTSMN